MNPKDFRKSSASVKALNLYQRQVLMDQLQPDAQTSASFNLVGNRVSVKPACQHCGDEKVSRWGLANGLQRYRCCACQATFNALTDTPLAGLRHKSRWIDYVKQLAEDASVRQQATATEPVLMLHVNNLEIIHQHHRLVKHHLY